MKIIVQIERLILEGLPVAPLDAPAVQAAVERALAQAFARQDGTTRRPAPCAGSGLRGGSIELGPNLGPTGTGEQIAQAIHSAIWEPSSIEKKRKAPPSQSGRAPAAVKTELRSRKGGLP